MNPTFFVKSADLRAWFEKHHEKEDELWIGFYKVGSGKASITWPESVDEALCFGWIDGIRKSIDENSYMIRFTPRKPKSIWSTVNIQKVAELTEKGLMKPAGIAAFEKREEAKSNVYSFEQKEIAFDETFTGIFKANRKAWEYFQAQPPYYKKAATWWVISAKQETTKQKRLETLIADSAAGQHLKHLKRPEKK